MTVPATAIYFTAYDQLKTFLCGQSLTSDLYAPMVAGALARSKHSWPLTFLSPSWHPGPVSASLGAREYVKLSDPGARAGF